MRKNMPLAERPESKLAYFGSGALSNAELLSLILRTGTKDKDALELASNLLHSETDLTAANVHELKELGISSAKASSIIAALELGKRAVSDSMISMAPTIRDSEGVARSLMDKYGSENREHFILICLDTKLRVIAERVVSIGSLDSAPVHPREVLSPAIRMNAAAIIVAHNHPSGDPTPSSEDYDVTDRLISASDIVGIKLLDHIIFGKWGFTSLKAEGYFDNEASTNTYEISLNINQEFKIKANSVHEAELKLKKRISEGRYKLSASGLDSASMTVKEV